MQVHWRKAHIKNIATWSCSSGYGKEKGSRLSQNILISRDNRSWILKWQFKHQRGKNILRSTGPGLWAVSVLLQLRLRMLMVGLGIYWVRTDLLILARVFMGHQYGSQVMNYYPTRQHQWLVIHLHLGSWRKKKKKEKIPKCLSCLCDCPYVSAGLWQL